jgi:lipopolysaccharide/colanic/teichoic acid biosynthesis glycosyltransferase
MDQPISRCQSKAAGESGTSDVFEVQDGRGGVGFYRCFGKRIFDFVAALAGLVVVSPILLFSMLLVRLTSRGPVLFRQVRVGQSGRPFRVFKFRTMRVGSEALGSAVVVPGDPRVTLVGRLLRRTKLDELPQLLNVLRGEMSLVGPRPRVPGEVNLEQPEERALLTLRPGLTSYASIYHRMEAEYCAQKEDPRATHRETILPQKSYLDMEYLKNLSFALDLKLILLTLLMVFVPGKAQPGTTRFFGVEIRPYGRLGQMGLDAAVFVAAVWLAYWLRFENEIKPFSYWQMASFIILLPAARLACNRLFGIYEMMWRYVNLVDAATILGSLSTVTGVLVLLRLLLPYENTTLRVFMIPLGVIALEYLLVVGGSLALRGLRRTLYEMNHRYQPLSTPGKRRILILGAGLSGLGIALEIGRYPHLQLVGLIDDDPAKKGRAIAGYSVLGGSEKLPAIVHEQQVSDIVICASSMSAEVLRRIQQETCTQGVKVHVIPTLDQILAAGTEESLQAGTHK